MTKVLTDPKYYTAIANAIRAKNGSTAIYKPSGMAAAISAIQVGGGSAAMYPKVRIKQTENQVIRATPKIRSDINSSIASNDTARDGYVDFDWYLSHGTPIQFEVTVSTTDNNKYVCGNLIVNGGNIGATTATLDIDKDLTIEAEDAQPISSFMPESYAVLYERNATSDLVLRVVSPSLSGGEEVGTAVAIEGTTSQLLCNVTDNAFNAINGLKLFVINGLGQLQEISITLQKGTPVSADVSGANLAFILAASINEATVINTSLG